MRFFVRFRKRYERLILFIEIAFRLIMFFYQRRYLLQPHTHLLTVLGCPKCNAGELGSVVLGVPR